MKRTIFILLPFLFLAFAFKGNENTQVTAEYSVFITNQSYYDITNWSVKGRQVLKDSKPFFAKGMCYQPVPIGQHPNDYPNGDYFLSDYKNIYEPDVDLMASMGVNAIKIYSWYPDKDHTQFLNYAYSKGIYIIVGYYMPAGTVIKEFTQKLELFKTLARNTAQHPAIMGYMLGNENVGDDGQNSTFWQRYNDIAAALKSIAPNKLVTTGLVDDGIIAI